LWDGVNGENGDSAASDLSLLDALFGHAALDAAVGGTGHLGTGMRRGLTPDEREYCANEEEIAELNALLHQVHQEAVPLRLQILRSKFPNHFKLDLLERLMSTENASRGESSKQLLWIQTMLQLPYHVWSLPQPMPEATDDTQHFFLAKLHNARIALDTVCHGHVHIKNALLERYYAWLCRPTSFLKPLAVVGPPGMGKTTLLRLGCTRAMERPVELLAMGAATDGSYLLGHNYTYEGSQMGILARMLSKCQCMNPVLLFDELDKVSDTPRGEEIYNVLLQITDPQQNDVFMDRYIGSSLPLDLSKCLCLFTLNNIDRVPAALLDRMTVLHTKPLTTAEQKVVILEHLLPPYLDRYELHTVMSPTFATPEALVRLQQLALQHGFRTVDALLGRACLWAHAVKHNHEEVLRGEILGGAKDSSKTFWHRTPQGLLEITADHVQHLYDGMTLTSPMLPYIL
jgi:ATP-dependent Lon protease